MNAEIVAHPVPHDLAEHEELVDRLREMLSLWGTSHPSLLRIYGLDRTSDGLVLLTAPEPPLAMRNVVASTQALAPDERARWAVARVLQLIGALASVGAVHGTIGRRTVRFGVEGRPVLDPPVTRITARLIRMGAGKIRGSLEGMSPEEVRGAELTLRSDVYSLGSLLYRLLGGPQPHGAAKDIDILTALATGVPARRLATVGVAVPSALDDVIAQAMAVLPDDRFASPSELGSALAPFGGESAATQRAVATSALASPMDTPLSHLFESPIRRPCLKRWGELTPTTNVAVRDCAECKLSVQRVRTLEALVPLSGSCVFYDPKP